MVHRTPLFVPFSPPAPDVEYAATLHTVLSALDSALVSAGLLGGMLGGYLLLVLLAVFLATSELRLPVVQYASSAPPPPDAAKQGGGMVRACGAWREATDTTHLVACWALPGWFCCCLLQRNPE